MLTLCPMCESCSFKIGLLVWNSDNLRLKASGIAHEIGNGMTGEEVLMFIDVSTLLTQRVCSAKCARRMRARLVFEMMEDLRAMSFAEKAQFSREGMS